MGQHDSSRPKGPTPVKPDETPTPDVPPDTPAEETPEPLLPENLAEVDAKELDKLERSLRSEYAKGRKAGVPDLDRLTALADALDAISADRDRRTTEAAERETKLTELDQRITPAEPEEEESAEGEEEAEKPAEPPKTVPAIAASAKPVVPPITSIKPPAHAKPTIKPQNRVVITAAADVPEFNSGAEIPDFHSLANAMGDRHLAFDGVPIAEGTQDRIRVATFHHDFPPERQLTRDPESDWAKIRAVQKMIPPATDREALAAAAGACSLSDVYYQMWSQGVSDRPIRDGLTQFQATRGGIRYQPPPLMTAVSGAITRLTSTQMAAGTTKNVYEVPCPSEVEVKVVGQSRIFRFSNWTDRFNPELREVIVENGMVLGARIADQALRDQIIAGSTAMTSPATYGASRSILGALGKATAGARSRWRIGSEVPLRCIIDDWVKELIRTDLAYGFDVEAISIPDTTIIGWFRDRGVNPIFARDFSSTPPNGQTFATPSSAGHLRDFPDAIQWQLFPEGTWLLLDGGELNLGVVRDSTRNASNTFDIFDEHFESAAFVGIESLTITTSICADGSYAPANDLIACVGS